MNIGTKSVLFGAHQFLLHPLFVALAWWRLYGFPWDPRLWVAFFVHDLGYWGKPNMDGEEGEQHPLLGAEIMSRLFDSPVSEDFPNDDDCPHPQCQNGYLVDLTFDDNCFGDDDPCPICERRIAEGQRWHDFTLYHSRFMARRHDRTLSRLGFADKLAFVLEPWWLYLPRVIATGEIREYLADHAGGKRYGDGSASTNCGLRQWHAEVRRYLRSYVEAHRDGRADTWTPRKQESEAVLQRRDALAARAVAGLRGDHHSRLRARRDLAPARLAMKTACRQDFPTAFLWRWHLRVARESVATTAASERRLTRAMARIERSQR